MLPSRYGQNGYTEDAVNLFSKMSLKGVQPDSAAFSSLLNAYSHARMVGPATQLFESISPERLDMVIYNSMVDVLARSGDLQAALTFIEENTQTPNLITWMTFTGACRTYRNITMAKFAVEKALELHPQNPPTFMHQKGCGTNRQHCEE